MGSAFWTKKKSTFNSHHSATILGIDPTKHDRLLTIRHSAKLRTICFILWPSCLVLRLIRRINIYFGINNDVIIGRRLRNSNVCCVRWALTDGLSGAKIELQFDVMFCFVRWLPTFLAVGDPSFLKAWHLPRNRIFLIYFFTLSR